MLTEKGKLNIVILFNISIRSKGLCVVTTNNVRLLLRFYYGQVHIPKVDKMENLMTTLKIDS